MPFVVYQITNTVSGKSYIGYTSKTLKERFREHFTDAKNGSKCKFHCAIRKYGVDVFTPNVLCKETTLKGAKESEILFILDKNPEYNMTLGGDCGPILVGSDHPLFGSKRPDVATRNRTREWSEEQKQTAREKQTGRKASVETREKMSLTRKGKKRGKYTTNNVKVSASNVKRKGTLAAALAAKKASEARWSRYRLNSGRDIQEKLLPE